MEFSLLTADEQKKIRARVERALCLNLPEETVIIQAPSDIRKHVGKLRDDMKQASVGTKLNNFVRSAFSIKNETEMLLEAKLRKLKETIQATRIVYVNFATRSFSSDLAVILYEIYRFVEILRPAINTIFADPLGVQRIIRQFLERRIPQAKTVLDDFITSDEMKDLFFKTESQVDLVAEINRRLREYCQSLPLLDLDQYAAGIVPLYYLRSLLTFPFHAFFSEFHYGGEAPDGRNPSFQNAALRPVLEMLETLYCLLHPMKKLDPETPVYPEILEMAKRYAAGELVGELEAQMEISQETRSLIKNIKNLMTITQRVLANVPLVEIIRYHKNDPYYKLMVYPPRLKLSEFYTDSLRMKILGEAEIYFPKLHHTIFQDVLKELFGGEPEDFDYFMNSGLGMTPKKGYAEFTHPRSLKILNTFIKMHYYNYIQGLVHSLNKVMSHRIRTSFSQLLVYAGGIESVGTKLRAFDQSFSPDAEDGKTMIRLKFILDKELSQQRSYVAFITKKNEDAKSLLDNGSNYIQGIYISLSAIAKDTAFVNDAAQRIPGTEKLLNRSIHALFTVSKLIRYSVASEKGAL
jgi:hypothetical protein